MTLDSFLELQTLPTSGDLMALCGVLDIRIKTSPPTLNFPKGMEIEALAIAKILRREPWRSQVLSQVSEPAKPTKLPPPPDAKSVIPCPACKQLTSVYRICEACGLRVCLCGVETPSTFDECCSICVHAKKR